MNYIRVINNGGLRFYQGIQPLAHIIWNEHNPNNPWVKGMVVHHKDRKPLNDDISNLELMTESEHRRLHQTGKKYSLETKQKVSEALKGNKYTLGYKHTEETKLQMSESHKGHTTGMRGKRHSEETKLKMSNSSKGQKPWNTGKTLSYEHKRKISESLKKSHK